ncbi:MAG TPA: T9SS type A sorting domain-containing protein [Bacteroidetes bacterium]|nr:T9SS type A sorting domain-containing protein [Bacteroidota bacterium]
MKTLNTILKSNKFLLRLNLLVITLFLSTNLIAQTFTTPQVSNPFGFNSPYDGEYSPVFYDYDNDGDCDLFMGRSNSAGRIFVLHENTGTSTVPDFSSTPQILIQGTKSNPPYNNWGFIPALADLDNDGDVDLIVGRGVYNGGDNIEYYENISSPGNLSFNIPPTQTFNWPDVISPAFTESNDLYIGGNPNSSNPHVNVSYYKNNGSSNFSLFSSNVGPFGNGAANIALGDLNLDGYKDIVVCENSTGVNWFPNDGSGNYSLAGVLLNVVQGLGHPALVDIDNDGDQDLFVGMENQFVFFENTSNPGTNCCDENQNIVQNGSVTGLSSGNLISGGPWIPIVGTTPQVDNNHGCNSNGCNNNGCFSMWGNQVVGEGVAQNLTGAFIAGHTYDISFCSRYFNIDTSLSIQYSWVSLAATNTTIDPRGNCTSPPCTNIGQSALMDQSGVWINTCLSWTPAYNYDYVIFYVENNSTAFHGDSVSWAQLDNICIQDLGVVNHPECCDSTTLEAFDDPDLGCCCTKLITKCEVDSIGMHINNGTLAYTSWNCGPITSNLNNYTFDASASPCLVDMENCFTPDQSGVVSVDYVIYFHNGKSCDKMIDLECKTNDCCDENQNIVQNGSVTGLSSGNLISGGPWIPIVGTTPQVDNNHGCNSNGCNNNGCFSMWGNQVVGEGVAQNLTGAFIAGHTYDISFCSRYFNIDTSLSIQYSWVSLAAANTVIDPRGNCTNPPCTNIGQSALMDQNGVWINTCLSWTPAYNYDYIIFYVENNSTAPNPDSISWAQLDDICIQDLGVNTSCMKLDYDELQCVAGGQNDTVNYQLNLNIVNISGSDAILQINPSAGSIVNFTPNVLPYNVVTPVSLVWSSPNSMRSVCFTIGLYSQADPSILLCDTTICFQCEPCNCCESTTLEAFNHPDLGHCCTHLTTKCKVDSIEATIVNGTLAYRSSTCGHIPYGYLGQSSYTFYADSIPCLVDMTNCFTPDQPGVVSVYYTIYFQNGERCKKTIDLECNVPNCCNSTTLEAFNDPDLGNCCTWLTTKCKVDSIGMHINNGTFAHTSWNCGYITPDYIGQSNYTFDASPSSCNVDMENCFTPDQPGVVSVYYTIFFHNGKICEKTIDLDCNCCDSTVLEVVNDPFSVECCTRLTTKCEVDSISMYVYNGTISSNSWNCSNPIPTAAVGQSSYTFIANGCTLDMLNCIEADQTGTVFIGYTIYFSNGEECDKCINLDCMVNSTTFETKDISAEIFEFLNINPNPSNGSFNVKYVTGKKRNVEIRIINQLGQVIKVIQTDNNTSGIHNVHVNTFALSKGLYRVLLYSDGQLLSKSIFINP